MNHVWPSITLRAPCIARPVTRRPLLELFKGCSQRQQSTRCPRSSAREVANQNAITRLSVQSSLRDAARKSFATSSFLAARGARSTPRVKSNVSDASTSKLEPAPTTASHTEGAELPEEEDQLTWRDFDPAGGMPLPDGQERSKTEIAQIFDGEAGIDVETGNYILNVMHWRRMSGALIDSGLEFPANSGVTRDQAMKGLQYVRGLVTDVDEQATGQVWVEEESLRLQEQIQERALKLGIYKRDEPEMVPEEEEEQQGTEYGRSKTGESQLVQMREASEAAWEKEEAQKAAEERRAEAAAVHAQRGPLELAGGVQPGTQLTTIDGTGISISSPQSKAWLQPVERKPWVKYYEDQAQVIKGNTVPQLSLVQRLGPSFLVLCAVLLLADFLASNYTTPPQSARLWPEYTPAVATLAGLSAILAIFFLGARLPPLWRTYSKYFTVLPAYPHALGTLGAVFRHDTLSHLGLNLVSLWFFGLMLHDEVGRGAYLAIFVAAGASGGFASLAYNVLRRNWKSYIFGASGAILGTLGATCVLRPNSTVRIWGREIPISAWVFASVYIGSELFALTRVRATTVDHMGHLGGLLAGMAVAAWYRRKRDMNGVEAESSRSEEVVKHEG